MEIKITKTEKKGVMPPAEKLGFGSVFSDHMFIMDYTEEKGWYNARIVPYQNLSIDPAASVLHYGTEVFEGLKAYRTPKDEVQLFRPKDNIERLNNSCRRLKLPLINPEDALQAITTLVDTDREWVPRYEGASLYIRPFLFSTDPNLSLHGVHEALFVIICSPSQAYFATGLKPVPIMVETDDVRAVRGGTGEAKCGGNYAAANRAGERAEEKGYSQVLWLDGVERRYVEEGGGMNVMFKVNGKIITPMLNGSILPGITRRSVIALCKYYGIEIEERLITIDEIISAAEDGLLEEAWCVGTAAVVCPIGMLAYNGKEYIINDNKIGPVSERIYRELTDIQWGRKEDVFGWTLKV